MQQNKCPQLKDAEMWEEALWNHNMQSCDLSPVGHLGHTQFHRSIKITSPLLSEAVAGVAILDVSVFQTNTIQGFFVFWGIEKLGF